jgi:hypothetical protein
LEIQVILHGGVYKKAALPLLTSKNLWSSFNPGIPLSSSFVQIYYTINMASSTSTSKDSESQIMSDVDFSEWLTEDCSLSDSPDSDFDELFSQITYAAASGGSDWHSLDWLTFDDLLKVGLDKVEAIELHPAEANHPELAPKADPKEPTEAAAAEIIPEPAPIVGEKPHNTEV